MKLSIHEKKNRLGEKLKLKRVLIFSKALPVENKFKVIVDDNEIIL